MSTPNYSLEVISHHPTFKNKSLRKYYVEGIETVGAWGDEPFEIKFTNHSYQKIQVKLTVDGTDVLTGEPGTTDATPKMWVVNGYGTLSLKAWPEDNNGGASFVFTSGDNGVAAHTHGDMTSRGIIAAAVYTEGHVAPYGGGTLIINNTHPVSVRRSIYDNWYYTSDNTGGRLGGGCFGNAGSGTIAGQSTLGLRHKGTEANTAGTFSIQNCSFNASAASDSLNANSAQNLSESDSRGLESLVAVGAGQHVDQKISYVAGLIKPVFTETVRVKYMWWDDLVAKLREHQVAMPQPSGFPADNKTNINLGSTPRLGKKAKFFPKERVAESYPSYLRV